MKKSSIVVVVILLIFATSIIAPILAEPLNKDVLVYKYSYQTSTYSLNWAGYAIPTQTGAVSAVYGSWIVPSVICSTKTTYVALWVGIDGYNSNTVEQTGILAQCYHGIAYYYAWYEYYPASPVYAPSSYVIKPGDIIYAYVTYDPVSNTFTTFLQDLTQGWTYTSPPTTVSGAQRSSAEWIVERPAIGYSLTKLANFGRAYFGYDYTSVTFTNYAVINGVQGAIGSFSYVQIIMVSGGKFSTILATPSPLTQDGTSFYVNYG